MSNCTCRVYPIPALLEHENEAGLKAAGKLRVEGKDYSSAGWGYYALSVQRVALPHLRPRHFRCEKSLVLVSLQVIASFPLHL